jgi:S1-C subfamily serine protease
MRVLSTLSLGIFAAACTVTTAPPPVTTAPEITTAPAITNTPTPAASSASPTRSTAQRTPLGTARADVVLPGNAIVDVAAVTERVRLFLAQTGTQVVGVSASNGLLSIEFDRPLSDNVRQALVRSLDAFLTTAPLRPEPTSGPLAEAAAHQVLPSVVLIVGPGGTRGAGFIISRDGFIMTAAHVVTAVGADPSVILYDGRRLRGRVVGVVQGGRPDVGILKVDAPDLTPVTFGDSSSARSGQTVMLAGHPGGYGNWLVTGGTLIGTVKTAAGWSQLHADLPGAPGVSGGPLFDVRGGVIGLVTGAGLRGDPPPSFAPNPFVIVWTWEDFAHVSTSFVDALAVNDARAKANAIIEHQGDVP